MEKSLLCYYCCDLVDPEQAHVPIGVLVRDGQDVSFKIMAETDLPSEHRPKDTLGRGFFYDGTLERIFRSTTEETRGQPLTFHFVDIPDVIEQKPLAEKAEILFERYVRAHYHPWNRK
ncbi:hypothetical protein HY496_02970 [Candidatus Woesearchaeota archaeon]|nr:hypothetical protein [Candidatus Woesearchaeota archaeon]